MVFYGMMSLFAWYALVCLEFQASEKIEGLELLAAKKGKHDETVPGDGSQAQPKISHDTGKGRSHMIQQMIGMHHYYHVLFIVLSIKLQTTSNM